MAGVVAYIDQHTQLGQETTQYTEVAANRQMQLLSYGFKQNPTSVQVRPQGYRVDTDNFVNMIQEDVTVSGPVDYHEFLLLIEMLLGAVAPTTPGGATLSRQRVYDLPPTGAIAPKSCTAQWGDSTYANQAAGLEINTLSCTYDRENGSSLTGSGVALAQDDPGTTFSASPTVYAISPARGPHLNFYLDTTGAGLGGTQITEEILSVNWAINNLRVPFWAADRAQKSYKKTLSNEGTSQVVTIGVGESAATRAIVSAMLGGATYFLRVEMQGPLIEGSFFQLHQVDIAIQLQSMTEYKNANHVYARDLTCGFVHDATWGHSFNLTSVTELNAL